MEATASAQRSLRSLAVGIALLWSALPLVSAIAAPLAKDACDALKTEQDALVTSGIKDDLAKGADWARGNLKPQRLQEIARFIELEEQLNFRCGLATARLKVEEPPADPAAATKSEAPAPEAKPKPKPRPKPKAAAQPAADPGQPAAAPAAGVPGTASAPPAPASKPQPKPQAKPKPKADDAFRPPPPNPDADPFAKQLVPKG